MVDGWAPFLLALQRCKSLRTRHVAIETPWCLSLAIQLRAKDVERGRTRGLRCKTTALIDYRARIFQDFDQ